MMLSCFFDRSTKSTCGRQCVIIFNLSRSCIVYNFIMFLNSSSRLFFFFHFLRYMWWNPVFFIFLFACSFEAYFEENDNYFNYALSFKLHSCCSSSIILRIWIPSFFFYILFVSNDSMFILISFGNFAFIFFIFFWKRFSFLRVQWRFFDAFIMVQCWSMFPYGIEYEDMFKSLF